MRVSRYLLLSALSSTLINCGVGGSLTLNDSAFSLANDLDQVQKVEFYNAGAFTGGMGPDDMRLAIDIASNRQSAVATKTYTLNGSNVSCNRAIDLAELQDLANRLAEAEIRRQANPNSPVDQGHDFLTLTLLNGRVETHRFHGGDPHSNAQIGIVAPNLEAYLEGVLSGLVCP